MAQTGASSGSIISAVTNNRLGRDGSTPTGRPSCSADLHGRQRWRSWHESPERRRVHSGGCEPESKCSRLSNGAHSVTGMAHPAGWPFIPRVYPNKAGWLRHTGRQEQHRGVRSLPLPTQEATAAQADKQAGGDIVFRQGEVRAGSLQRSEHATDLQRHGRHFITITPTFSRG